jgi:hypothetical protein
VRPASENESGPAARLDSETSGLEKGQLAAHIRVMEKMTVLALQLPSCFEVRPLSSGLVSSAPERPCNDVCGLDALSSEPDSDAADLLNRPTDQ